MMFRIGLSAALVLGVNAAPKLSLRDRNSMNTVGAATMNAQKWSTAKQRLRMNRNLGHWEDDDYNALSHAVHEFCGKHGKRGGKNGGKDGGKNGGKNGGKDGGKNGKQGSRRLHQVRVGCYDYGDSYSSEQDDFISPDQDDTTSHHGENDGFLRTENEDDDASTGDDKDSGPEGNDGFQPPDNDDSDDLGVPPLPSFVPLTGDDRSIAATIPPSPSFVPLTGDDRPISSANPTPSLRVDDVLPPSSGPTPFDDPLSPAPVAQPDDSTDDDDDDKSDGDDSLIPATVAPTDNTTDDDTDDKVGDDHEPSPSNESIDLPADDDGDDDDDDEVQESPSNEGTNRNGVGEQGGGFIPDAEEEITNEDFVPTNGD